MEKITAKIGKDRFFLHNFHADERFTNVIVAFDDGVEFWLINGKMHMNEEIREELRDEGSSVYPIIRTKNGVVIRAGDFIQWHNIKASDFKYRLYKVYDPEKGDYFKFDLEETLLKDDS